MAKKIYPEKRGRVVYQQVDSAILKDNPLGDPSERVLPVYLPYHYDLPRAAKRRFPLLVDMAGFTGSGLSHTNWRNFEENVPEKLDRLIASRRMPPCIVAFPDCFTALGGNQYINSSAIGRYADYLTREILPHLDRNFRTTGNREQRACFGKSSGGYGAMVHGLKYARYWGGVGNHSGDAYFDFVYKAEWPKVLTALQGFADPALSAGQRHSRLAQANPGQDDGRIARFLDYCWSTQKPSGTDITVLMMVCMAATYDPDPRAPNGFRLPYDLETGELLERRWKAWLKHDPIHMVARYKDNLKKLKAIFIDCGWRDQYYIHFGSRQLSNQLRKHGITHRYEEFNDTHSGIGYRMDVSLPYLARQISAS